MTGFLKNAPRRSSTARRDCLPGVRCECPPEYARCMTVSLMASVEISSSKFSWDNSGIVTLASVDRSEIGILPNRVFDMGQRSAGFVINSERTGNSVTFKLVSICTDADNDVCYWEFKPVSSLHPAMTVLVYND